MKIVKSIKQMNSLLIIFATAVAITQARPEITSGYNYPIPSNVGLGGLNTQVFSSGSSTSSLFSSGLNDFGQNGLPFNGFGLELGTNAFGVGGPSIQKHIYVHVPPPDQEESFPSRVTTSLPAQKHYKIIFIKTPSTSAPSVNQQILLNQQNQEKTIVYVLVKKPEDQGEVQLSAPLPTQPSKPEVYFIRYKSRKGVDNGLGASGSGLGGSGVVGSGLGGSGLEGLGGSGLGGLGGSGLGGLGGSGLGGLGGSGVGGLGGSGLGGLGGSGLGGLGGSGLGGFGGSGLGGLGSSGLGGLGGAGLGGSGNGFNGISLGGSGFTSIPSGSYGPPGHVSGGPY